MSSPELFAWFAAFVVILGVGLILGLATRYTALASFLWVLVATAIAHRYWTYPESAQLGQYINLQKKRRDHGRDTLRIRHWRGPLFA